MNSLFGDLPLVEAPARLDIRQCHQLECAACPLHPNYQPQNKHPFMPPSGADRPLVYVLGEAPGREEDEKGRQFVGESGSFLRARLPRKLHPLIRYNNVVRTRPPKNRTPGSQEIECCRPSVIRDIEASKPKVIFGFGNIPLTWVSGFTGITIWRGRRMPVRVGNHVCWYYSMLHPAYLVRKRGEAGSLEEERAFNFDIKRAVEELDTLPEPVVLTAQEVFANIDSVYTVEGVKEALDWAMHQKDVGVDYETDRLRPYADGARILTVAVANAEKGYSIPLEHPEAPWKPKELETVLGYWQDFLWGAEGRKWVHNLAFELEWTGVRFGAKYLRAGKWEDTSTQASILDERHSRKLKPGPFSLEFLGQQYFGINLKKLSNLDRSNLANTPLETVLKYNGGDARFHCLLGLKQRERILDEGLVEPYRLALRRVPTVVLTQMKGVPVNPEEVKRLQKKYEKRIAALNEQINALPVIKKFQAQKKAAFQPFSNPDVMYVFKDLLNRQEVWVENKWSGKTKLSADKKVLDQIDHPLAKLLIELREANKRKSTYIDPLDRSLPVSVLFDDGMIHGVFNTYFAETGRLSSEHPNLQNFPKRDGEAREVRKQIVAPPGCVILAFDYGQIEARVIAMFTKDKVFCKALWDEYDVHMEWAERLARAYPQRVGGKKNFTDKKVMKDFRTDIKNQWTFPLFFGARLESAAGYLKIPVDVLEPEYNKFWKMFAGVKQWQEGLLESYKATGYVECLTGRRRHAPLSLNQVINSPVQGTAAEIVLEGMSRLSETEDPVLQPEINIHDDLTYCRVPLKRVDEVAEKVITGMLSVPFKWVNVPISVEMSLGDNWLEMEDIGKYSSDKWLKGGSK